MLSKLLDVVLSWHGLFFGVVTLLNAADPAWRWRRHWRRHRPGRVRRRAQRKLDRRRLSDCRLAYKAKFGEEPTEYLRRRSRWLRIAGAAMAALAVLAVAGGLIAMLSSASRGESVCTSPDQAP